MRRSRIHLAIAMGLAFTAPIPAGAEPAPAGEVLHVEFTDEMPAFVQTWTAGGRDVAETSVRGYEYDFKVGDTSKRPVGYAVRPAPAGCDRPNDPCPLRREALPDDRSADLPGRFNIEIVDEPEEEFARLAMRNVEVNQDGPSPWVSVPAGQYPYKPYGGGTVGVLATQAGKLRPGALAQADCYTTIKTCTVRITYSSDLRVNFMTSASDDVLARQVRAVDAVMRSVIRPGPFPLVRVSRTRKQAPQPSAPPAYIPDLPQNRINALLGKH